jgi:hypothetical protein
MNNEQLKWKVGAIPNGHNLEKLDYITNLIAF